MRFGKGFIVEVMKRKLQMEQEKAKKKRRKSYPKNKEEMMKLRQAYQGIGDWTKNQRQEIIENHDVSNHAKEMAMWRANKRIKEGKDASFKKMKQRVNRILTEERKEKARDFYKNVINRELYGPGKEFFLNDFVGLLADCVELPAFRVNRNGHEIPNGSILKLIKEIDAENITFIGSKVW